VVGLFKGLEGGMLKLRGDLTGMFAVERGGN
jgi:hypothetical protein